MMNSFSFCAAWCSVALLTIAMTFAYRGAEYSRLTIALWGLYSITLIYALRELDKTLFRRLLFWVSGPQQVLVIGKGKVLEAIRQMTGKQPFVQTHFHGISARRGSA